MNAQYYIHPCNQCGMPGKKISLVDCGPIRYVRCDGCHHGVSGSGHWDPIIRKWNEMNTIRSIQPICLDDVFHVHTYRCKHAGEESDSTYIKRARELGAKRIIFTDHAPFPGDPFGNRMKMRELKEYITTLKELKEKYIDRIEVQIGLEIEYLPSFQSYYEELSTNPDLEWLCVGQHFYEHAPDVYSFFDSSEVKNQTEDYGMYEAMIAAVESGMFRVVAHPDRAFKRRKKWSVEMEEMATRLICSAIEHGVALEKNYRSMERKRCYWPEFWELAERIANNQKSKESPLYILYGSDAHCTDEMQLEAKKQMYKL